MAEFTEDDLNKVKAFVELFGDSTPLISKAFRNSVKESSDFQKEIKKLNKEVARGTQGYKDQINKIKELEDAIDELEETTTEANKSTNEARRATLLKMREDLKAKAAVQGFQEGIRDATKGMSKQFLEGAGDFVKNLQNGSNANELSADILRGGVDVAAAGAKGLGQAAETSGQMMMLFGGRYVKIAGAALEGLGIATDKSSDAIAKFIKFGIDVLSKEVDRTIKAFDTISTTGAAFTNGLTGMRDAAGNSQLTVEQFAKVLSTNTQNISETGLGYTETLNKLSKVQATFGKGIGSTRDQLQKLGFSFEDQANLTLEIMNNMRRAGTLGTATDTMIRDQTREYAENLRVIAAITGEDAKKRMEEAKKSMQNTAIQAKILEMQEKNPEAYAKLQAQLATMPAEMQKAYLQKIGLGAIVDPVSAVMMARVPAMRSALDANQAVLEDATKNATDAENEAGRQRGIIAKNMRDNIDQLSIFGKVGLAGLPGLASDTGTAFGSMFDQLQGQTEDTNKLARDGVVAQMKAQDKLTNGMMKGAQAAQDLAINIQNKLLPMLGDYVEYTGKILGALDDQISGGKSKGPSFTERLGRGFKGIAEMGGAAIMLGATEGLGAVPAYALGAMGVNDLVGAFDSEGMSDGGIAKGPKSGYPTTLHGTEAVVPLPDGKTIPVNMDTGALTSAVNQQSGILTEILRAMRDNNTLTSGILQHSM